MLENLGFMFQTAVFVAVVVGVPLFAIIFGFYAVDALRWGRWQRYNMTPKRRRRTNGSVFASHIGRVRN